MRLPALALSAALAVLAPAARGADFTASNGIAVFPTGPNAFSTGQRSFAGISDHWCAAGDFVVRRLNLSSSTRIYRLPPTRLHAGKGMNFSLDPKGAVPTGITTFGAKDIGMSASEARNLCEFVPDFLFP